MVETRNLHDVLRNKTCISDIKKKTKTNYDRIFSLAWNIVYWLLKSHCFEFFGCGKYGLFWAKKLMEIDIYWLLKSSWFGLFGNGKYGLFLRQKVNKKMTFTDYCYVLVLNFSGTENTVFFWGKKLMERWYLPINEKFLFWAFPWWKMRSYLRQKVSGKMIFADYWKVHVLGYRKVFVLSFSVMGNTIFFLAKKLM